MPNSDKPAVVLLSGGLDSATCLAICEEQGFVPFAISFRYGQRHSIELERAAWIAKQAHVARHIVISIDMGPIGGSALTDSELQIPKHDFASEIGSDIPLTYVPARNTVFLSYALGWAEVLGALDIFIGVNALDYSGYPDCRPEYIAAFEAMANLATKAGVEGKRLRIHTPLLNWTKAEIIREGMRLGVDYSQTLSCYDPSPTGVPCGHCDSCLLRSRGFEQNGLVDPAL
ncbi:MAG: 7-cyano-7-deazaguanine synthase QueC [Pirellula sp.]